MIVYCVKAKEVSKKRWKFVTSTGGVNNLRIHASQFSDKAKADGLAADINESNPGEWQAKVEVFAGD
jgi:hypothetical protein